MNLRQHDPEAGQTNSEYALILAGLAVFCLVVLVVLGSGVREHFRSTGETTHFVPVAAPRGPFTPPVAPSYPETLEDCEDGGWREYHQFLNERECKDYVRRSTP